MDKALVPVRSSWASKINWTAIGGAVMTLVTTNALGLEPQTQVKVLAATQLVQSVATVIFRTWFNNSVSPASLGQ